MDFNDDVGGSPEVLLFQRVTVVGGREAVKSSFNAFEVPLRIPMCIFTCLIFTEG